MTQSLVFAIPGDLAAPTGGYAYDRRMIAELRHLGWTVDLLALPASFPFPGAQDLSAAARAFAGLPDGTLVLVDGLAFGAMEAVAEAEARRLRLVALVHHPLALEAGLEPQAAESLRVGERRALAAARAVVTTSRTTAETLVSEFGVAPERIHVAVPGTELGPRSPGEGAPPLILSVGSLIPRKGHDVLVEALALIRDLDWRCRILGSPERHPDYAASLAKTIEDRGLGPRVELLGEGADPRTQMAGADLFALATFHEGYGMVFAEAMSHGLPVVGCAVGAVPEVVPPEAGTLVPAGDAEAFASALRALVSDPDLRRRRAAGAFAAGAELPSWAASARHLANALAEASS